MELKTQEQIKEHVEVMFEQALVDVYQSNNVTTGDIMPHQHLQWVELVEQTAKLFHELLLGNQEWEED